MVELTPQQHQAIAESGTEPTRAIDPATKLEYVLIRAEVYERIKSLVVDERGWAEDAYSASLEVFAREGWDDPRMSVYDALDPRKSP